MRSGFARPAVSGRSSLLEAMGKREELQREASLMYAALETGRWSSPRAAWEFHLEEARRWSGAGPPTKQAQDALALSNSAEWIYNQCLAARESKGRRILRLEARPVLISWTADEGRLTAALAGPDYLESAWNAHSRAGACVAA